MPAREYILAGRGSRSHQMFRQRRLNDPLMTSPTRGLPADHERLQLVWTREVGSAGPESSVHWIAQPACDEGDGGFDELVVRHIRFENA